MEFPSLGGVRGGFGGPWGGGRSLMDFAPEVHALRLLSPWSSPPDSMARKRGGAVSFPFRQCKVTKKIVRNKIALRGVFGVRCLWCHTCPQSAYLKNNIIIYYNILLYYFFTSSVLTCIPCICPFLRCQCNLFRQRKTNTQILCLTFFVSSFLRTFAAAKSNEEVGKDIV